MKITLRSIVAYIFGIPVALLGVLAFFTNVVAGILLFVGGVLALPVVRRRLGSSIGLEFSGGAAALIFLVCTVAGIGTVSFSEMNSNDGTATGPGHDVANVSLSAQSVSPADATAHLSVRWNSRAQSAVDPDSSDLTNYQPNDGNKFVVVRMNITNTGSRNLELTPRLVHLQSNGVVYESQILFGSGQGLSGVTLAPGGSYTGWTVFSVPNGTAEGSLVVNQDAYISRNVAVEFTRDPSILINMST